jgi:hypothetical protein
MTSTSTVRSPFGGVVYCHAPAGEPFSIEALAREADAVDRWSIPGTRTVYLASTAAVAAAEWARHATDGGDDRSIVALELEPVEVLDLRAGPSALAAGNGDGGHDAGPVAFLDRTVARRAADDARRAGVAGILVPSVAFPDRADEAFNIVLFCEALPDGGVTSILANPRRLGRIRVGPAADGGGTEEDET